MLYWLFTEARSTLTVLLLPSLCAGVLTPPLVALLLGMGIQRRADGTPLNAQGLLRIAVLLAYLLPNAALTALYVAVAGGLATARATSTARLTNSFLVWLIGGPATINQQRVLILGFGLASSLLLLNLALATGLRNGGWLREQIDRWRRPENKRMEMGSAHFCTPREFRRFRRADPEGLTLLGAFWGEPHRRLDFGWGRFCLSGEDVARGVLTLGAPGSGKSQAVILPIVGDRMHSGHSLIIADPQGELTGHVLRFARATGHLVVVHDPTSASGPRYNLAAGIDSVSDAKAIAKVLIPAASGDNRFWTDSASDLLSACLIRFDNLGQIKAALDDLQGLSKTLATKKDDAALLASAFIASVNSDGKVASNVVATLGTALTGWASADVRASTSTSDFDAGLVVAQPTVIVLTCPGRMRDVYAPYLGATLRKLMLDLDSIGEKNRDTPLKGALPVPVGIILDEFPTLGRLDSLVADVNLVRKRRISIVIAAQTKGQFHLIYGDDGTQALLTGMATQIIFGGGDHDTADYYSRVSGTMTVDTNPDPAKANLRQRPLLTADELVSPQDGNCTIFSRYVVQNFATQIVLTAQLTPLYERQDWQEAFAHTAQHEPFLLQRGTTTLPAPDLAAAIATAPPIQPSPLSGVQTSSLQQTRAKYGESKQ